MFSHVSVLEVSGETKQLLPPAKSGDFQLKGSKTPGNMTGFFQNLISIFICLGCDCEDVGESGVSDSTQSDTPDSPAHLTCVQPCCILAFLLTLSLTLSKKCSECVSLRE